jgi:hypothetical protein
MVGFSQSSTTFEPKDYGVRNKLKISSQWSYIDIKKNANQIRDVHLVTLSSFNFVLPEKVSFGSLKYGVVEKSGILKYYFALTGMFRCKPASEFLEGYHSDDSVLNCTLNMEDVISNNFCKYNT